METKILNTSWKTAAAIGGTVVAVVLVCACCGYSCEFKIGDYSMSLRPNEETKRVIAAAENKPAVVECAAVITESQAK